ncbi:MAG: class I SAM-dependent methyltransferase [Gemmatimonadaceae bacterium]|nr:class I SAM-dependent methyltransferase [Gemmatimonadaceae bacterium]
MLSPQDLSRVDMKAVLRDAARKQGFVTPMFEHIAPRYDAFTRLFSFGMDARWKGTMLGWLAAQHPAPARILDVACGTGDLALVAARRFPNAMVTGVDAAERMIELARCRTSAARSTSVQFLVQDLTRTSCASASIDAMLAGYAFRNIPRLDDGLAEAARVVRPGGWLYTLDFYRPTAAWWRATFLGWLRASGSAVGWWWHRAPVIYAYIADSIDAWVDVDGFEAALARHGFSVEQRRIVLLGGVAMHAARRQ